MGTTVISGVKPISQKKKATIPITGATGTIGRELVSVLVSRGMPSKGSFPEW